MGNGRTAGGLGSRVQEGEEVESVNVRTGTWLKEVRSHSLQKELSQTLVTVPSPALSSFN